MDEIQKELFSIIGGEDPQELIPLVERQLAVCERELAAIPERAANRGEGFMEYGGEAMENVMGQLRHYQAWLSAVLPALQDHDQQALVGAYEQANDVIPPLTTALDQWAVVFSSFGSYQTTFANALARAAEGIRKQEAPREAWSEFLRRFINSTSERMSAIRNLSLPGRTACLEGYQGALEVLSALKTVEDFSEDNLKPAFLNLDDALSVGSSIEKLMADGREGPTALESTNVLISMVKKFQQGELDLDLMTLFVDDYCDMLDQVWDDFETAANRPIESALVQDEIPKTLGYAERHDAVVEALSAALSSKDNAAIDEKVEALIASAKELESSRDVFATAEQHQGSIPCPNCGRANPPENRNCEACGATLPRASEAEALASSTFSALSGPALETTQQLVMTENIAALFQACDDVAVGTISKDEFAEEVNKAAQGLLEYAKDIEEISAEVYNDEAMPEEMQKLWREHHLPYIQEIGQSYAEGIRVAKEGLDSMTQYLEDPNDEHLVEGIRLVWEAMGIIHRAELSMNESVKMLEDVMQEAREDGLITEEIAPPKLGGIDSGSVE